MVLFKIMHNRTEGPLATSDDLEYAGQLVDAMMRTRPNVEPQFEDYWVVDSEGNEYYWSEAYRTVFSASCGDGDK